MNRIRDEVIPLVLSRVVESINERDCDQMDELMTPYLAKLYKAAIADLDAQGFRMHLEIATQEPVVRNDYGLVKYGNPDAFDYTIPYGVRADKYVIKGTNNIAIASYKDQGDGSKHEKLRQEFGVQAFIEYLSLEFGYIVNANIKVDLYKGSQLVDSESGMMEIPVAISTPAYVNITAMANAVSASQEADAEKPFEWRVCDLFYTADQNSANEKGTSV
ncbi:hypothetical protein LPJ59_002466 [Coemansia sp. RSA 2399]|nr:hypothetical protein LPJ59_002466 [Coemansia sp. RSA 2399]KAJ1903802.1 hypothetical protein LPJ81_002866 [Coemansia sp. IMI 209127]